MSIYTTVSAVRAEAGLVGNTDISDAAITQYITDAEADIDTSISERYPLPLSAISGFTGSQGEKILSGIARRIATGLLLKSLNPGSEFVQVNYEDAKKDLSLIQKGQKILINSSGAQTEGTNASGYVPTFYSNKEAPVFSATMVL